MKFNKLGKSDLQVSAVGFGAWALGNDSFGEIDEGLAIEAIKTGIECGINLVDTAPAYGDGYSERVIGKAIKGMRERVLLATKCGLYRFQGEYFRSIKPTLIRWGLERSLLNLGTDYIDLLQIHYPDLNNSFEAAFSCLADLKKEGKIREIGICNFTVPQIQMAMGYADITSMQPQLSLLNQNSLKEIIPFCVQNQLGLITYGTLAGGILTGRFTSPQTSAGKDLRSDFYHYYDGPNWSKCQPILCTLKDIADSRSVSMAEVAINWSLAQNGVSCALVGATKPYQAAANANAGNWELSCDELKLINDAYNKYF